MQHASLHPANPWTAFHATLARQNTSGQSELFNQASPGSAPATGTGSPPSGSTPGGSTPAGNSMNFIWIAGLFLILMMVVTSMGGRKQKRQRAEMLSAMKKYDRVLTIGG